MDFYQTRVFCIWWGQDLAAHSTVKGNGMFFCSLISNHVLVCHCSINRSINREMIFPSSFVSSLSSSPSSIHSFFLPSVCPYVHLSYHPFVCPLICLSICLPSITLWDRHSLLFLHCMQRFPLVVHGKRGESLSRRVSFHLILSSIHLSFFFHPSIPLSSHPSLFTRQCDHFL